MVTVLKAAYSIDFLVSFTRHSLGILEKTSPLDFGQDFPGCNALPLRPPISIFFEMSIGLAIMAYIFIPFWTIFERYVLRTGSDFKGLLFQEKVFENWGREEDKSMFVGLVILFEETEGAGWNCFEVQDERLLALEELWKLFLVPKLIVGAETFKLMLEIFETGIAILEEVILGGAIETLIGIFEIFTLF